MATSPAFNFFQPASQDALDYNQIQRQRDLARLMTQQGLTPQQGQMVGNHYVAPGAASYIAQIANALLGHMGEQRANEQELALGQRVAAQRTQESQDFMRALNGTPATTTEVAGPPVEGGSAPTQTTPAVPGDVNRAMALAMSSQNPMISGMAPELMKRQMDAADLQNALNLAGIGGGGAQPSAGGAMATGGASNPAGATGIAGTPQNVVGSPSGATGLPRGVSPQAFALSMSRNPQAQNLGKMVQEASKPLNVTEGGTVWDPITGQPLFTAPKTEAGIGVSGGVAAPIPNFAESQARRAGLIAGAEAAARDPYAALVRVDTPAGPRMMTPAQSRAAAQGTLPVAGNGGGPVNGQPIPNPMAPRPEDTDRGLIYKQELDNAAARMDQAKKSGDQAAFVRAQQDIAGILKEVQSNKIQMPQGTAAPVAAPVAAPSTPVVGGGRGVQGGPGIPLQTEESQAYATSRAKSYAEQAPKLQQAGQDAASTLRNLDTLETLYKDPNVAKGALAENISGLKNIGASFGIEMKGLSSEQAAEAITNKMALASRSTAEGGGMPGSMSDADRKFLANMQPGLTKTPEGRAQIIDAARKVAQRQIDVANLARNYEQQNGQLDLGFDQALADYAAKNQMFTKATPGGGFKILGVK
jgi:hypothetical protein